MSRGSSSDLRITNELLQDGWKNRRRSLEKTLAACSGAAKRGRFKIWIQQLVSRKASRLRNSVYIIDTDIPLSRFALAQIGLADVCFFAQFSLAQAGVFARSLHILSDELTDSPLNRLVFSARH